MSDAEACSCGAAESTVVLACSGSSNVGQITNNLALALTRQGLGHMSCLAGVGAHLSGFVVSAKDCDRLIVLDGCPQNCALEIVEHVGITPGIHLTLTEHGFKKSHDEPASEADVARAQGLLLPMMKGRECSTSS